MYCSFQKEAKPFASRNLNFDAAEVSLFSPALVLQWYPLDSTSPFQPYLGAGINYTIFTNKSLYDGLTTEGFTDLSFEDSWGAVGQLGMDYLITDKMLFNVAVWYMEIDTKTTLENNGATFPVLAGTETSADLHIDPWIYMVGIGYKF